MNNPMRGGIRSTEFNNEQQRLALRETERDPDYMKYCKRMNANDTMFPPKPNKWTRKRSRSMADLREDDK